MVHTKPCEVVSIGLVLVLLGGFFLLARLFEVDVLALPLLSGGFIVTGILAGISLETYLLAASPWRPPRAEEVG